jgi:ketosteroid isomerase-like protein
MSDHDELIGRSEALAAAIARRDVAAVRTFLAPGFVHRSAGGDATAAEAVLAGITQIPGDILFVKVEQITTDVAGDHAIVTGIQHAQLKVNDAVIVDRRRFVDLFVREGGEWRVRVAVDFE